MFVLAVGIQVSVFNAPASKIFVALGMEVGSNQMGTRWRLALAHIVLKVSTGKLPSTTTIAAFEITVVMLSLEMYWGVTAVKTFISATATTSSPLWSRVAEYQLCSRKKSL